MGYCTLAMFARTREPSIEDYSLYLIAAFTLVGCFDPRLQVISECDQASTRSSSTKALVGDAHHAADDLLPGG